MYVLCEIFYVSFLLELLASANLQGQPLLERLKALFSGCTNISYHYFSILSKDKWVIGVHTIKILESNFWVSRVYSLKNWVVVTQISKIWVNINQNFME